MTIDQDVLVNELKGLEQQRRDAVQLVDRIDGAVQVVRHLLAKTSQPEVKVEVEAPSAQPCLNGSPEVPVEVPPAS